MSMIQPITAAVRQVSPKALEQAASVAARSAYGNIATGQLNTLAATSGFGGLAYFFQAAKDGAISVLGKSIDVGTSLGAKVFPSLAESGFAKTIGLAGLAVGDLATAGAAGLGAWTLNSFTKITTGTGLYGLAKAGVQSIAGLFSRGANATAQAASKIA